MFPQEVVVLVLQHMHLKERIKCSLVQHSWKQAAATATTSINLRPQAGETFVSWLAEPHEFSQHVTSIRYSTDQSPTQRTVVLHTLPYPALLSLRLEGEQLANRSGAPLFIGLGPHKGSPGIFAQCSDLQECVLDGCVVHDKSFKAFTSVTKLTSLTLHDVESYGSIFDLRPITTLNNLQQLCLGPLLPKRATRRPYEDLFEVGDAAEDALRLPALTKLDLQQCPLQFAGDLSLAALTGLQHLRLVDCFALDPDLLASYPRLQRLEPLRTPLARQFAFGALNPTVWTGIPATAEFLAVLAQLQDLRVLVYEAKPKLRHQDGSDMTAPAPACSSLTANSKLEVLKLQGFPIGPVADVWPQLFLQGRTCPRLLELALDLLPEGTEGVGQLVSCCPMLQQLSLSHKERTLHPQQLQPLVQLAHLSQLTLNCVDRSAGAVIAQVTQLTGLTVGHRFGDVGLLHLTKLTQLQAFRRIGEVESNGQYRPWADGWHHMRANRDGHLRFDNQAPAGAVPDVVHKIMQYCHSSAQCEPVLELQAQLAEQAAVLAATQQQLAAAQGEAADLRRQLQQLQEQQGHKQ